LGGVVDSPVEQFTEVAFNAGRLDRPVVPDPAHDVQIARPTPPAASTRPALDRRRAPRPAKHDMAPKRCLADVRKKVLSTCPIPQQFA